MSPLPLFSSFFFVSSNRRTTSWQDVSRHSGLAVYLNASDTNDRPDDFSICDTGDDRPKQVKMKKSGTGSDAASLISGQSETTKSG